MRAARKFLVLGLLTFAIAFAVRRIFFWDVMPVAWDQPEPRTGALEAAFLLLTIENVAAAVAAIALAVTLWLWFSRRRRSQS